MDINSLYLVLILICLGLSAFFASAETAFVAVSRLKLKHMVSTGLEGARRLEKILEHPEKFLSTILLGNNFVNIAAATLGTIISVSAFGPAIGVLIATVAVTVLILVFGEVIPKSLAAHHAERLALFYVRPVELLSWLLYPFVVVLSRIGLGFTRMAAELREVKGTVTEEEIRTAIKVGKAEGIVEEAEAEMLHKVFEFSDRPVREAMTPRTEIVWVEHGTKLADFLAIYSQSPYSRFPVYKESTDNVVGILSIKDVLMAQANNSLDGDDPIDDLVRPAHFVPETKRLGELLAEMRAANYHMVIVVDEFGGTAGVATLEELIEEIVGSIGDELAGRGKEFVTIDTNTFEIEGGLRAEEANEELGLGLPLGDYETVAGFVLNQLGHIPKIGEQLIYKDLKLTVIEMQGRKIERLLVTRGDHAASAS